MIDYCCKIFKIFKKFRIARFICPVSLDKSHEPLSGSLKIVFALIEKKNLQIGSMCSHLLSLSF